MNTPAHVAASLLVWRNEKGWKPATAVVSGAVAPDAPMYVFYGWQRLVADRPESLIWSTLYYEEAWQLFFDLFNSIPIAIVLIAVFYWLGFRWGMLAAASALLHMLCDLPVHHDDGHRHFLPISNWRFASPVSYWDPNHHGLVFMACEFVFGLLASGYVALTRRDVAIRTFAGVTLAFYCLVLGAGAVFLLTRWNAGS